ncbi:MAG TPA: ATP synthase F1 subunit delta [Phaeodactylibacter sp.]|nr:ATP synthase F1 subunit delta [Phaeodactylibacter sp.]
MSVIRIASRYAKSLIDLANEKGKLDKVVEDIQYFQAVSKANGEFYRLLKSPIISTDKKKNVFNAIFAERFDDLTKAFLDIILRKGREFYLADIVNEFMQQYRELQNITQVKLTTATKLSEQAIQRIKSKLQEATAKNIEIQTATKPELIGGFVLEFDDKLYDSSIANQLERLRKTFSNNEIIKN